MTESEWLDSVDPTAMLRSLIARWSAARNRGETVDFGRLRWFAVASCRRIWDLLDDDHRTSVGIIEEFARTRKAGLLRKARQVRWAAGNRASAEYSRVSREMPDDNSARALAWGRNLASSAVWQAAERKPTTAVNCCWEGSQGLAERARSEALAKDPDSGEEAYDSTMFHEGEALADILRDIVGNPFRSVVVDSDWLTSTVVTVARTIDEEHSFGDLPILADALEDVGCDRADILEHCRSTAEHVRGCWVIEALLVKG